MFLCYICLRTDNCIDYLSLDVFVFTNMMFYNRVLDHPFSESAELLVNVKAPYHSAEGETSIYQLIIQN